MPKRNTDFLIIGAGFAGLSTAILLKRAGFTVTVFESSHKPRHVGGGVILSPNGMRVLRKMKLADEFTSLGNIMSSTVFYDGNQNIIAEKKFAGPDSYGENSIFIKREKAHESLTKTALGEGIEILYDKKLASIEQGPEVTVKFADGSFYKGSLLIGADGAGSITRKNVLRDETAELTFQRLVYAGGFIDKEEMVAKRSLPTAQQRAFIGKRGVFAFEHIHNSSNPPCLYWGTFYGDNKRMSREEIDGLSIEKKKTILKQVHEGYPSLVYDLIDEASEIVLAPISDIDELPTWSKERLLLIGDAAHAVSPIIGLGINMSLEDADMLTELFKIYGMDFKTVFRQFERLRKPRVTKIIETARKSTRLSQVNLGFLNTFRNFIFSFLVRAANGQTSNWIYSYSVEKELEGLSRSQRP